MLRYTDGITEAYHHEIRAEEIGPLTRSVRCSARYGYNSCLFEWADFYTPPLEKRSRMRFKDYIIRKI